MERRANQPSGRENQSAGTEEALKSEEPIYIRQTAEPHHLTSPLAWCRDAAIDGRSHGANFFRSCGRGGGGALRAILIEGWVKQPDDQGEPRWQVEAP